MLCSYYRFSERVGPYLVVGARTTLGLNSAGHLKLCDRMVEVRADATTYALARVLALQCHPLGMFELFFFKLIRAWAY